MRAKHSFYNVLSGIGTQFINIISGFVLRTVFIKTLGQVYLGVNGLFTNILSVLSLAELGVGTAIIYSMYKPLAQGDNETTRALMKLYQMLYWIIGTFVFVMGIAITPFLQFIIKDSPNIPNLHVIYVLFVLNSATSYFLVYNRSIAIADQKNYTLTGSDFLGKVLTTAFQIAFLYITKSFVIYLIIMIVMQIGFNFYRTIKVRHMYPFLKEKAIRKLKKTEKREIYKNISALMIYKIAQITTNSVDTIIISAFIGIVQVGMYSNYNMLIVSLTMLIAQVFNSITPSVGNLVLVEATDKKVQIFNVMNFMAFWLHGFCSIALVVLLNPFIELWLGKNFVFPIEMPLVLSINFYMAGMQIPTEIFRNAYGLFWKGKLRPIAQTLINILLGVIFVKLTGNIASIIIATIISRILTYFWFDPYIVFKYGFERSMKTYFIKYGVFFVVLVITALIVIFICSFLPTIGLISFISKFIICSILSNIVFFVMFFKTDEFKYLYGLAKKVLTQKLGERK